ncbi:hypothetical protein J4219_05630 [Candidatus Woesearchaeota archaeon]|nr:hypothetical protein [Candidatus Woesearchaeota archaeon]
MKREMTAFVFAIAPVSISDNWLELVVAIAVIGGIVWLISLPLRPRLEKEAYARASAEKKYIPPEEKETPKRTIDMKSIEVTLHRMESDMALAEHVLVQMSAIGRESISELERNKRLKVELARLERLHYQTKDGALDDLAKIKVKFDEVEKSQHEYRSEVLKDLAKNKKRYESVYAYFTSDGFQSLKD